MSTNTTDARRGAGKASASLAPALKSRQQMAWASGDYAVIDTTLQLVGELLAEACDLRCDEEVLDVAAGNGNVTLAAAPSRGSTWLLRSRPARTLSPGPGDRVQQRIGCDARQRGGIDAFAHRLHRLVQCIHRHRDAIELVARADAGQEERIRTRGSGRWLRRCSRWRRRSSGRRPADPNRRAPSPRLWDGCRSGALQIPQLEPLNELFQFGQPGPLVLALDRGGLVGVAGFDRNASNQPFRRMRWTTLSVHSATAAMAAGRCAGHDDRAASGERRRGNFYNVDNLAGGPDTVAHIAVRARRDRTRRPFRQEH